MMTKIVRQAVAVWMMLALLSLAIANQANAAQEQDAAALLDKASATMLAATSFHFVLSTPRGKSLITDQIELTGIEGDVQRPDRFRAEFTAKAAFLSLTVKVVGIGGQIWVTDPTKSGESWIQVADGSEGDVPLPELLNPDKLVLAAVDLLESPVIDGEEEIDGVKTTRVVGTFNPSTVGALAGTPVPELGQLTGDEPIPVTIWIDEAGRVPRLEFAGPLTAADSGDVIRQIDVTKIDEPVDIQPPV